MLDSLTIFPWRMPAWHRGRLGDGAKDNLNLDFVQFFIPKFDNFVEPFLANFRLGLLESLVMALDHRTPNRPLARLVALDALLQRNIKKENYAGNVEPLRQFLVFLAMLGNKRRRIHHTEAVQAKAQLREGVYQGESLGLKALIPLVVAHPSPRPVRRNNLSGAKVALRKSRFSAGSGSTKQNDGRANQSYSLDLTLILGLFLCHSDNNPSFPKRLAVPPDP
jgi:hypothetical protein